MINENEQRRLILKLCYEFKTVLLSRFCVCITVAMIQLQYMDFRVFMTSRFKLVEIMSVSTIALASRSDLIEIGTRILRVSTVGLKLSLACQSKLVADFVGQYVRRAAFILWKKNPGESLGLNSILCLRRSSIRTINFFYLSLHRSVHLSRSLLQLCPQTSHSPKKTLLS